MSYQINPLSPVLGAEVVGLDLNVPLSDAVFSEIEDAWQNANGVLVFKGQDLAPAAQIAFSKRLGDLEVHVATRYLLPEYPEIYRVSTKQDANGSGQVGARKDAEAFNLILGDHLDENEHGARDGARVCERAVSIRQPSG